MKSHLFLSVIAVAISLLTGNAASAQGIVAVLDVAEVFNKNLEFDTQMQSIRTEADSLKDIIQGEQEKIRSEAAQLQGMPVGSSERNQLEASLEQKQTALRTKARQAETDLLAKEAQLYYATYQKMQQVVARLAETNNVALVLRFDGAPIDKNNRAEVIMGVNRAVVFQNKVNLTELVVAEMGPVVAAAPSDTQIK